MVANEPHRLIVRDVDGSERVLTEGIPATGEKPGPNPFGSDAAYIAALASTYSAFADYYESCKAQKSVAPPARGFMSIEDGLRAVVFVDAVLKNCTVPEEPAPPPDKWTPIIVPPIPEL